MAFPPKFKSLRITEAFSLRKILCGFCILIDCKIKIQIYTSLYIRTPKSCPRHPPDSAFWNLFWICFASAERTAMKKFLLILLTIVILLAGGICGLYLNLESIVKASVAKYGSQLTGTEVALDGFRLSPLKGEAELKGLRIANPAGYQTPHILSLGSAYVRLDMRSLLKPVIVVEEIRIANPEIAYELKSVAHNNVSDLLAAVNKNTAAAAAKPAADQTAASAKSGATQTDTSKTGTTPTGNAKPAVSSAGSTKSASSSTGKKVIINALNITGGKVSLGATFGGKGAAASVPLPAVTLKDIGREKDSQGKGIIETASLILKKILDTAYDTAVRQGLNSLKDIAGESADTLKGTAENLKNSAKGLLGGLL